MKLISEVERYITFVLYLYGGIRKKDIILQGLFHSLLPQRGNGRQKEMDCVLGILEFQE